MSILRNTINTNNDSPHVDNKRPKIAAVGAGIERLDIIFDRKEYPPVQQKQLLLKTKKNENEEVT